MRSRPSRAGAVCALALLLCLTTSCATGHLMKWSRGEPSAYRAPTNETSGAFVRPAGTILAFPAFFVWDVATFPFQWIWGVYPYGGVMTPADHEA